MINQLSEVVLTEYRNITTESLGIIPKGMKTYTPAERKLKQATGGDNQYGLSTRVSFDAILNAISGRTRMLKKELEIEKKEILLENVKLDYSTEYLIKNLNIPEALTEGFLYYLIEDREFVSAYKSDNKTMYPSRAFDTLVESFQQPEEVGQRRLYAVTLAVTNRCHYRCWHCYNADRSPVDLLV